MTNENQDDKVFIPLTVDSIPSSVATRMMEYDEDMQRLIQEHEDFMKKVQYKNRIWTAVILVLLFAVSLILWTTIGYSRIIYEHPEKVRHILVASLGCLLLGFIVARWVERLHYRLDAEEDAYRRRKELIETQYPDVIEEFRKLKAQKNKQTPETKA